jgi:acyl-CoA thioesterase I
VRYCARVRRKLALTAAALALVAAAGGAVAATALDNSPAAGQQVTVAAPQHARPGPRPLLAVVGASFSAGVGADGPDHAWPADLARIMGWRLAVSADPGAGYVNPGAGHRGPFSHLAGRLHLARLDPGTVIIQGGHDDIGRPLPLIRSRVEALISSVRRQDPRCRLAVLTVFPRGRPSPAALATDQAIVAAARHADPAVLVFDPIASHWQFPRIGDHLHPTPAGHEWIARHLAAGLRHPSTLDRAGSRPAAPESGSSLNVQPGAGPR